VHLRNLQFYFNLAKLTFLFNSKQAKRLNKLNRYFLENQAMKYTHLQERVGFFADIKFEGGKGLTQL